VATARSRCAMWEPQATHIASQPCTPRRMQGSRMTAGYLLFSPARAKGALDAPPGVPAITSTGVQLAAARALGS